VWLEAEKIPSLGRKYGIIAGLVNVTVTIDELQSAMSNWYSQFQGKNAFNLQIKGTSPVNINATRCL